MSALLTVDGVRAGFGSNAVLHGVSFEVREGEIAAILGLNGAGKSVTMKVIGGVVPAWQGRIEFAGEDITGLGAEARVARGMAHVPQGRQVFPELTVEQNLRLGAYTLRRRNKARYAQIVEGLFERFPVLAERRSQAAGTLSGGEQAMLAVSRALACEPQLVLVDEASAGLAPVMVKQLFDMLRAVNQSGVTLLVVEQNVTFSLDIADRAHIMQRGQIVYEGAVPTLDTAKVAAYLGVGRLLSGGVSAAVSRRGANSRKRPAARKRAPQR
jgi:branched-chain amino acid transport system ATP-binding protein